MTKQRLTKSLIKWAKTLLSSLVISAAIVPHVSAHLMVAQRGTLNFKGDYVFMVLSIPVSAFNNIDDDGDSKMSKGEFTKHRLDIISAVKKNVLLSDKEGARPLRGLLLSPVAAHSSPRDPTDQLVVMGRFSLSNEESNNDSVKKQSNTNELTFHSNLFGKTLTEKSLAINATRKLPSDTKAQKFKVVLTPEIPEAILFNKLLINKSINKLINK
ncbi:hypothetical protein [uncultured Cocleimonas sp.]|uniref:hypothetical protein n=1 Tax=uncultured Cocleimonas sp. TaxID=1051587 RepID=UPI00262CE7E6|nr:hypothetical protein [uncultured Cocleimonas sp.]